MLLGGAGGIVVAYRVSVEERDAIDTRSSHFERHQVSVFRTHRFVVHGDLPVSPGAGKIVGADQEQGFVVGGTKFQRGALAGNGKDGGGGM